jgi:UDP-N-acetylglucosamine 2-epimerase (non-hydrolysing)
VFLVAGARPNFVKIAPLFRAITARGCRVSIVHTGQHYDSSMSDVFFDQLGLPVPDITLQVGSAPHGAQTARVLERFEAALKEHEPDAVVVVGDVNSTLACALATSKIHYDCRPRPLLAHVEAGLRSRDRSMPEEVNRVLTDAVSDLLFTTEASANANLAREGFDPDRIHFVGNVMIDCLVACRPAIAQHKMWERFGLGPGSYGVVTLHRPANVDDPATFRGLMASLQTISDDVPLVFPIHPRTRARLDGIEGGLGSALRTVPPMGYLEFISLLSAARCVLTDSGGLQEESTFLGIPCFTLRDNTERPVTITHGTNRLVGSRPVDLVGTVLRALGAPPAAATVPALWDGRAAERVADLLSTSLYAPARGAAALTRSI